MPSSVRAALALLVVAAAAALVGCGGSREAKTNEKPRVAPGTVAVLLTDAPTDRFERIYLRITRIELMKDGDDPKQVTVFQGDVNVDLMRLAAVSDLLAVTGDVPAGSYDTIRMVISGAKLVDDDAAEQGKPRTINAHVTDGHVDLTPRLGISVPTNGLAVLELDVDAERSVLVNESTKPMLRPAVFARHIDSLATGRLIRVHGVADGVDAETGRFNLCPVPHGSSDEASDRTPEPGCLPVRTGRDTGIYGAGPEPESLSSLNAGDELSAIGFIRETDTTGPRRPIFAAGYRMDAVVLQLGPPRTFARDRRERPMPQTGTAEASAIPTSDPFASTLSGNGDSLRAAVEQPTLQ
jgi:hypothetical protein